MQLGSPNDKQTSTMSYGIKKSKVKITRHKKQVSIRLLLESNIAARCVRKPRWVFLAAMPHRASQASVTGFSLRHFPDVDAAADITAGFFRAWSFFRSQPAAITLPSWVMALVVIITT